MDKEIIIENFIKNFILKEKRERSVFELNNPKKRCKFTNRLNHHWDKVLNMNLLKQVEKENDNAEAIQNLLKIRNDEPCYIISNYAAYDDKIYLFGDIFNEIYQKGLATLIVNLTLDTLFLETEQEQGAPTRFIGKVMNS